GHRSNASRDYDCGIAAAQGSSRRNPSGTAVGTETKDFALAGMIGVSEDGGTHSGKGHPVDVALPKAIDQANRNRVSANAGWHLHRDEGGIGIEYGCIDAVHGDTRTAEGLGQRRVLSRI